MDSLPEVERLREKGVTFDLSYYGGVSITLPIYSTTDVLPTVNSGEVPSELVLSVETVR